MLLAEGGEEGTFTCILQTYTVGETKTHYPILHEIPDSIRSQCREGFAKIPKITGNRKSRNILVDFFH